MADKKTTKASSKKAVEVKTIDQLNEEVTKLRNDYRESQRSHQMGELVNPRVLTVQRKSVARALTALKQAQLAEAKSETKEEN